VDNRKAAAGCTIAAIVAALIAFGLGFFGDGGEDTPRWPDYNGTNGENTAQNIGQNAGAYLDAIKARAIADPTLSAAQKTLIKDRCDALKGNQRFANYTKDETYLIIVVAERHSTLNHWGQVWKRLGGTLGNDASWSSSYKPAVAKIGNYNKTVKKLINDIRAAFPGNTTIQAHCNDRELMPHSTANRNTSWARILLAFELASNTANASLVGMELDHPEGTTS